MRPGLAARAARDQRGGARRARVGRGGIERGRGAHYGWGAMEIGEIEARAEEIGGLLRQKARLRGRSLETQMARARRALPRRLRRDGARLAQAAQMAGHPKLARQIDLPAVEASYDRLKAHLGGIDPKARRRRAWLDAAALVALVVLVAGAGAVWWLVSTGRV